MINNPIYADYNANVPIRDVAKNAMLAAMEIAGNSGALHKNGQALRRMVENARRKINGALGNISGELIFTSGATEAAQLAIDSAQEMGFENVFLNISEHDCVYKYALLKFPNAKIIGNDENGVFDVSNFETSIDGIDSPLVILMAASNETGVIQPVSKISNLVRQKGGAILVDAVQAMGKTDIAAITPSCDWLIISGHKIGAPIGVGALLCAAGITPSLSRPGGGQEKSYRSGTINVPAIAAFGEASMAIDKDENAAITKIRNDFEAKLKAELPSVRVFGENVARLGNTSCFAIDGLTAETTVISLDLDGICVSAGSACSSGSAKVSRAISAITKDESAAKAAIRVSFGYESQQSDANTIVGALVRAYNRVLKAAA